MALSKIKNQHHYFKVRKSRKKELAPTSKGSKEKIKVLTAGLKNVQKLLRDAKAEVEADGGVATASEILSAFFTNFFFNV